MVQASQTKTIALAFTLWAVIQPCLCEAPVGLTADGPAIARLYYPLFHVGIIHALLNSWCFLSVVFLFPTTVRRLLLAYAIAASVPAFLLTSMPVLGLSGFCYALMGMLTLQVRRPWYWQRYLWFTIFIGLLVPNMAVALHAYCFAVGTLFSFINTPIIRRLSCRKR